MKIQGTGVRRLLRKIGFDIIACQHKPLGESPIVFDIGTNIGQTVYEYILI